MSESIISIGWRRRIAAWLVHAFTASGAVFGLFSLTFIHRGEYISAFWLMSIAILIDAVDGVMARAAMTKIAAPRIDGALLDNIIDYLNYVIVPAFFIVESDLLSAQWRIIAAGIVVLASAYQFSQRDAKTDDHFFKGFPSYWNIVVFYLFFLQMSPSTNLAVILGLTILVFVPIKYVYPSRLDYLTKIRWMRLAMLIATLTWGVATALLILIYPDSNRALSSISLAYVVFYLIVSLYRTIVPLHSEFPSQG